MAPPCSTFSGARKAERHGPGPLRDPHPPGLYGRTGLSPEDQERVKIGTLCAFRCVSVVKVLAERSSIIGRIIPWTWETPARRQGKPSIFNLPEVAALDSLPGVTTIEIDQCRWGARTTKPTEFKGTLNMDAFTCDHPAVWWAVPWSGETYKSPHPHLRGRQWAIPWADWRPTMLRHAEPAGPFLTRGAAAYPGELNRHLAATFVRQSGTPTPKRRAESNDDAPKKLVRVGFWGSTLVRSTVSAEPPTATPLFSKNDATQGHPLEACGELDSEQVVRPLPLRGPVDDPRETRRQEDSECLGGMARAAEVVRRQPGSILQGG